MQIRVYAHSLQTESGKQAIRFPAYSNNLVFSVGSILCPKLEEVQESR